jgi:hypothetical protein
MRERLSRRAVIAGAGAAGALALGTLPAWRALSDAETWIGNLIVAHLRGAPVAEGTIASFVADFLRVVSVERQGIALDTVCAFGPAGLVQTCTNNAAYLRRIGDKAIDLFIRSTDMLDPARPPSEPIRYVAFWDPYSGACRNPFADFAPEA